jgi:hypothetical protein
MKKVAGAVVIEGFEEKHGVALKLEESATVMGSCGDEVRAGSGGTARGRHVVIVNRASDARGDAERVAREAKSGPQRLKPRSARHSFGTAEAVPLSKTKNKTMNAVHHGCR